VFDFCEARFDERAGAVEESPVDLGSEWRSKLKLGRRWVGGWTRLFEDAGTDSQEELELASKYLS